MSKEVIIIDDGSTDNTPEIIELFPHVKYIYQENLGVSSARNLGIKNSTCEWIAFLDSDDEWHEDKLKEQVEFHKENSKILMSYTDETWVRDGVEVKMPKKYKKHGGDVFEECLSHCIIAPSATLINKEIFNTAGLFDESLEVCEDYDLWLRVACENHIGLIDKKLVTKYGGNEDQLSMKHWGMDRFRVQSLENILNTISEFHRQEYYDLTLKTLVQKYVLLLKGAKKHNKFLDINMYEKKINYYQSLSNIY